MPRAGDSLKRSCFGAVVLYVMVACGPSIDPNGYVDGVEHCAHHVDRYFEWHRFAVSVGRALESSEIETMEKLAGRKLFVTPITAYLDVIAPEQNVLTLKYIAAKCRGGVGDASAVGLVSIKYTDRSNIEMWRYATSYIGGTLTVGPLDPQWERSEYVDIPLRYLITE